MKKIVLLFISLFLFINVEALSINSKSAILYNLNDNNIIYEKNGNDVLQIASLTKIVTAITVIENVDDLNQEITITYKMLQGLDGYAKVGFYVGDKLTYLDLLYALMLPSAADAAQALAIATSGSIEEFSNLMNQTVEKIGVLNSKFDNPVGMDSDNNYSTAYDLAKILIYCLENETFETIFNSDTYIIERLNKKLERTIISSSENYNLDISMIKGAKTGFTYGAGLCLASTSTIENVDYLLVTLGSEIDYPYHIMDSLKIYDYYSTTYGYVNILSKDQLLKTIDVKNSKTKTYNIYAKEDVELYLEKTVSKENLKYEYIGIETLTKEVKKGDKLGYVNVLKDNNIIYTYDVYLDIDIKYYNYLLYCVIGISLVIFVILICLLIKKLKNKK